MNDWDKGYLFIIDAANRQRPAKQYDPLAPAKSTRFRLGQLAAIRTLKKRRLEKLLLK